MPQQECLLSVLGVSAPQERDVGQRQDVGLPIRGPEGLLCGGFIEVRHRGTGKSRVDSQQRLSVGGDGGEQWRQINLSKPF